MTAIITRKVNNAGPYAYRVEYSDAEHDWEYLGPVGRVDPSELTAAETAELREEGFALARFRDNVSGDVLHLDVAQTIRSEFEEAFGGDVLAPTDDKRSTEIELAEDAPMEAERRLGSDVAQAEAAANEGSGQAPLTKSEKDRIDFSKDGQNVMHARSAKAELLDNGVKDWTAHYSGDIESGSFSEIAEDAQEAAAERGTSGGGGQRLDSDDEEIGGSAASMAAGQAQVVNSAEAAVQNKEDGWQDAADVLRDEFAYSDDDINELQA